MGDLRRGYIMRGAESCRRADVRLGPDPRLSYDAVVRDPGEFSDRSFSPEDAEDWTRAFFWGEGAAAWRDAGFEPEEAQIWDESDLEPEEAARWRALLTPAASSRMNPKQGDHTEWHAWREACAAAAWWRALGFSLAEAERWLRAGFQVGTHNSPLATGTKASARTKRAPRHATPRRVPTG
jgi:hypothetical protein